MSEIWKPQPREVYLSWVEAIEQEASDKLTEWETNFVTDIGATLRETTYSLSQKQAAILERIYAEKTK